jgi:cation transporter-like permease
MVTLAWTMARAGGLARSALLAGCTAAVSGLLLVAVALLLLSDSADEQLASFVRDGGTRGGVVFAVLLLTLPPLLLLDQAVRLGSGNGDRRLAALRVAGATPAEVRRLGAIEVGIPTSVGAVLGIGVFAVLRELLGGRAYDPGTYYGSNFAVVPTSGAPNPWQVVVVVIVVAVAGTFVGWWASRAVVESPLGVTRRERKRSPRPWGFLLLLLAVALTPTALSGDHSTDFVAFIVIALIVGALVMLAPWVAYVIAQRLARRTDRPESLLAAQRIIAEPGAAGRAAGAIGGIALVSGGVVGFVLAVRDSGTSGDSSYMAGAILVAISLLVGLLVAAGSMAVHSVESLLDRRREVAFLAASGMLESELELAARREITVVALPLAAIGSALGAATLPAIGGDPLAELILAVVLGVVITVTLVWLASALAVRAVRPWARRAASPLNLRTE